MSEPSLSFREGPARDALLAWWRALQDAPGERAELRRCKTVTNVFFAPAFHRLRFALGKHARTNAERLAVVAAVLAHVKTPAHGSFASQMAAPKSAGKSATVSGLRFRRLIKVGRDEHDKLLRDMIRMVRFLGDVAHITDLANGLYWWNDQTRRQWATDYYTSAPQEQ
jgi:CRISPR system Cascade subunit CasB